MVELAATLFVILVLANFIGLTVNAVGWWPIAIVLGIIAFLISLLIFPDQTKMFGVVAIGIIGWALYQQHLMNKRPTSDS